MNSSAKLGQVICVMVAGALTLAAQSSNKKAAAGSDPKTPWIQKNYKTPLTPWGQPDLQGVWASASNVPLQRAANLGDKAYFTSAELTAKKKRDDATPAPTPGAGTVGDVHYDLDQFGLNRGDTVEDLRTSLIMSPASGRIPNQTAAGRKRNADRGTERTGKLFDSTEYRGLAERCILWGNEGPPITPLGYNPNLQIVQTKDYVAITQEMIHDTRIIPLDGRPHLPAGITQWFGDSRGHFEGDTLVIDRRTLPTRRSGRVPARSCMWWSASAAPARKTLNIPSPRKIPILGISRGPRPFRGPRPIPMCCSNTLAMKATTAWPIS